MTGSDQQHDLAETSNGSAPQALVQPGPAPPDSAREPQLINATIIFVDLMDSVRLSNSMTLLEYNELINDYQDTLRRALDEIKLEYEVGEHYIGGDQLAIFFYDPADTLLHAGLAEARASHDLARIQELEAVIERKQNRALYGALRCAVRIKNAWIGNHRNVLRVYSQQGILDLGIGINTGQVVLQQRGDGRVRIEGYAINFAKRVEGFARQGRHCKVMLSKRAFEIFRETVSGHVMLKQRAMFEPYEPQSGLLKGLQFGVKVYELKFFHRLGGFGIPEAQVELFTQIFKEDPTNLWAYVNLVNFHLYTTKDMREAQEIAQRAASSNVRNEKIYYDLGLICFNRQDYASAKDYCQRCIRLNDEMDVAYDLLGDIAEVEGDLEGMLAWRNQALIMAPRSAGYALDVALALAKLGKLEQAARYYARAVRYYPEIGKAYEQKCAEVEDLLWPASGGLGALDGPSSVS